MSLKPQVGRQFRLNGGSRGESSFTGNSNQHFFQKGVANVYQKKDQQLQGVILPARDPSLSPNDTSWPTSVIPYRDVASGNLDADTQSPAFTSWFAKVVGYKFFGRHEASFLSPLTLKDLAGDGGASASEIADPIRDCATFLRRNLASHPEWEHFLEKETQGRDSNRLSIIPRAKDYALVNYYYSSGKEFSTAVLVTSYMALEHLKTQLTWPTPRSVEPVDKNFEDFLFGDVTDPSIGLIAKIGAVKVGELKTNGFVYGTKDFTLNGIQKFKGGVPATALKERCDLTSSATLQIWTYQQLLDYIVADGVIPYELIQLACSGQGEVGKQPARNTATSSPAKSPVREFQRGPAPDDDQIPMDHTPAAPEDAPEPPPEDAPAPPDDEAPAPPEDAPAPPAELEFWVSHNGVRKVSQSEVQAIVDEGKPLVAVMAADKSGGWKKAPDFGITPQAQVTPPATSPAASSTAPAAPAAASPVAAPGALNEEEAAEYAALKARASNIENPLQQAEVMRLLALTKKSKS